MPALKIENIEADRMEKLESLLCGKLGSVKADFFAKLAMIEKQLDKPAIESALTFAEAQDYGQGEYTRYYITHPLRVAGFCCDWMAEHQEYSTDWIVAALIHNVFEKDVLEKDECRARYGDWIFRVIDTITPDREALKTESGKESYYRRIYELPPMGQLLKFYDKFDNIYALCLNPDTTTRTEYLDEIKKYIRPIGKKYHPSLLPYFDALIENNEKLGHFKPKFRG
jgi:(p)ppGpp synthase/HD superfamily hydrolase